MVTQNTEHRQFLAGNRKRQEHAFDPYFSARNPEMDDIIIDTQILVKTAQILVEIYSNSGE